MRMVPPPRKETRPPAIAVPPLACDCHLHIVGPAAQYPMAEGRSFDAPDADDNDYRAMRDTLGLTRAVVVQPSIYGFDNRRTVAAVAALGRERTRGVAALSDAVTDEAIAELSTAGIRATRFITTAGGGPAIDRLAAVAKRVAPFGWHVEMYVTPDVMRRILPVIEASPATFVLDHMAGLSADMKRNDPGLVAAILDLLRAGRCWTKLVGYRASAAGHPYGDVADLARMLFEAAPERCVWGSDWPHFNMETVMPDDGDLIDLLADWVPDVAGRQAILVDNPARLYGFG